MYLEKKPRIKEFSYHLPDVDSQLANFQRKKNNKTNNEKYERSIKVNYCRSKFYSNPKLFDRGRSYQRRIALPRFKN
jgi:hypothetical protein